MLYPVSPEKIQKFKDKLNAASDADDLPRPSFGAPEDLDVLKAVSKHLEGPELGDPVDGYPTFRYRGKLFALIEASWPSPLYDNQGDRVLFTGNVPAGPDPMAMWSVLYLLP